MADIKHMASKVEVLARAWGADNSLENEILGLHEAATKIWIAKTCGNAEELRRRVASALIGVLELANVCGIDDLASAFDHRLVELRR